MFKEIENCVPFFFGGVEVSLIKATYNSGSQMGRNFYKRAFSKNYGNDALAYSIYFSYNYE